jgi:transketolase
MFDFVARQGLDARVLNLGVQGSYRFELGTRAELHEQVGIGLQSVARSVRQLLQTEPVLAELAT